MKLNLYNIFESMDARQKHVMKHADDLRPEKISYSIAENALNTRICQKYNLYNGVSRQFNFNSYNDNDFIAFINNTENQKYKSKFDDFFCNLINVISNFLKEQKFPHNSFKIYYQDNTKDNHAYISLYSSDLINEKIPTDLIHSCSLNISVDFINKFVSAFYCIEGTQIYEIMFVSNPFFNTGNDHVIGLNFKNLTLAMIDNGHIDGSVLYKILNSIGNITKYFFSPGYMNLIELIKSMAYISEIGIIYKNKSTYETQYWKWILSDSPDDEHTKKIFLEKEIMKRQKKSDNYCVMNDSFTGLFHALGQTDAYYKKYMKYLSFIPHIALYDYYDDNMKSKIDKILQKKDICMNFIKKMMSDNGFCNADGTFCKTIKDFMNLSVSADRNKGKRFIYKGAIELYLEYLKYHTNTIKIEQSELQRLLDSMDISKYDFSFINGQFI